MAAAAVSVQGCLGTPTPVASIGLRSFRSAVKVVTNSAGGGTSASVHRASRSAAASSTGCQTSALGLTSSTDNGRPDARHGKDRTAGLASPNAQDRRGGPAVTPTAGHLRLVRLRWTPGRCDTGSCFNAGHRSITPDKEAAWQASQSARSVACPLPGRRRRRALASLRAQGRRSAMAGLGHHRVDGGHIYRSASLEDHCD